MGHRPYTILLATVALLSGSLIVACSQAEPQSEEPEFLAFHGEMVGHVESVQSLASELQDFTWRGFDDIGSQAPPAGCCSLGTCIVDKEKADMWAVGAWTPLSEMLPSTERATLLLLYCDKCLDMAEKVISESPFGEPHIVAQKTEKPAVSEWQELCSQLESTLMGAEYFALNYRNTAKLQLDEIEEAIANSSADLEDKYLGKFRSLSAEYIGLLDEIMHNLQRAEQVRSQLDNWQFNPSGVGGQQSADLQRKGK